MFLDLRLTLVYFLASRCSKPEAGDAGLAETIVPSARAVRMVGIDRYMLRSVTALYEI